MYSEILPTLSVETEGLVRAAFTLMQEKKEKEPAHKHDYYWLRISVGEFPVRVGIISHISIDSLALTMGVPLEIFLHINIGWFH